MSQLRKIKRNAEKEEEQQVPEDHDRYPVGKVLTDPVKGEFLILPLLSWVSLRAKTKVPLVMLRALLIEPTGEMSPKGLIQIEMPVYPETERGVLGVLERFGWDGRIWPLERGWPDEEQVEADNLRTCLNQAVLKNTLVFPPSPTGEGVSAQPINVARARGPFLMQHLPIPEGEPNQLLLDRLRELCLNPQKLQEG